jgi:hypothetical protein
MAPAPSACIASSTRAWATAASRSSASTPTPRRAAAGWRPRWPRSSAAPAGVLLGTQVVAKGHDFPDVTLGVVLDADATLRSPTIRAEERTFALIAQLAGRAGRGPRGGRVLVQTLDPTRCRSAMRRGTTPRASSPGSWSGGRAVLSALRRAHPRGVHVGAPGRGAPRGRGGVRARPRGHAADVLGPAPLFRLAAPRARAGGRQGRADARGCVCARWEPRWSGPRRPRTSPRDVLGRRRPAIGCGAVSVLQDQRRPAWSTGCGSPFVNWYWSRTANRLTAVDAGLPGRDRPRARPASTLGHRPERRSRRSCCTHSDADHTGVAELCARPAP